MTSGAERVLTCSGVRRLRRGNPNHFLTLSETAACDCGATHTVKEGALEGTHFVTTVACLASSGGARRAERSGGAERRR